LTSLHPWIILTKFDKNLLVVSGEEEFEKKIQCIFTLLLLSPLGEGQSPLFEET
jgi:hypothetical protein